MVPSFGLYGFIYKHAKDHERKRVECETQHALQTKHSTSKNVQG